MCVTDAAFREFFAQDGPNPARLSPDSGAEARDAFIDLFCQVLMIAANALIDQTGCIRDGSSRFAC